MSNQIVTVNVSIQAAPTPSTLQQTGALISQGATNLGPGVSAILTQLGDLTPLINGSKTLASLTWSGGIVTATATTPHGYTIGDTIELTIAGTTPVGYNGTFLCTITTSTAFTYAVAATLVTPATVPGGYTPEDVSELNAMATTFFGQGAQNSVYVLELGAGNASDGVAALRAFITLNSAPQIFYAYLVPRYWDANSDYLAFLAGFESTTSKTYFFTTTTLATYTSYTPLMKDVLALIEAPATGIWQANALTAITYSSGQVTATTTTAHGVAVGQWFKINGVTPAGYNGYWQAQVGTTGSTLVYNVPTALGVESVLGTLVASYVNQAAIPSVEFSLAAAFWKFIGYSPSSTNKVTPFAFSFAFGVTPFPSFSNGALLSTLKLANINYIGSCMEGGLSNVALFWGMMMDGRDATFWYSLDWMAINSQLALANIVMNGSNNPVNPLYLSQDGINSLQNGLLQVARSATVVGLANGTVTRTQLDGVAFTAALNSGTLAGQTAVNAVPFVAYYAVNPGDYKIGKYAGFSIVYVPNRGFIQLVVNIVATDFIAQ